ncbi:hypothetical protein [Glutamicibacter arilaitensis]|uniref:hypothetical protein n=1 Tax=Glutamicibacter arilaitensis TaxID=256701 RepID=UPI00384B25B1
MPVCLRILVAAALVISATHLVLLIVAPHDLGWSLALLLMTAWCVKCTLAVAKGESPQALMLMSALMGLAHIIMVLGLPGGTAHHSSGAAPEHVAHAVPMLMVGAAELMLMFFAAVLLNRSRSRTLDPRYAVN